MNLSPLPIQKFFDNNGRPLAGGLLFTYAAGTSNKIATYVDADGTPQNTNPVVLDFRGECRLWIDPTLAYKYVLARDGDTDPPGAPIWSVDNITAGPAQQDNAAVDTGSVNNIALSIPQISSPVAFTRIVFQVANDNTGPVTISINGGTAKSLTWQSAVPFIGEEIFAGSIYEAIYDGTQWQLQGPTLNPGDIRIFGINPDGVTDLTAAIQAALTASSGKCVTFSPGIYRITSQISIPSDVDLHFEDGAIIDASSATHSTPGLIVSQGTVSTSLGGGLSTTVTAGAAAIVLNNSSHGLAIGDLIIIHNPANGSWNPDRTSYKQGEFLTVKSTSGATINLTSVAIDTYAATCEVYKVTPTGCRITGHMTLLGNPADANNLPTLYFRYGRQNEVSGVRLRNTAATCMEFSNCFMPTVHEVDTGKYLTDSGGVQSSGVVFSGCQYARCYDSNLEASRHGASTGGGGLVVDRFNVFEHCKIASVQNNAADFHGCAEFCAYINNHISGAVNLSGARNTIADNEIYLTALTTALINMEAVITVDHTIDRNRFYLRGAGTQYVLDASAATDINANTTQDGTLKVRDNEIFDDTTSDQSYLFLVNNGSTAKNRVEVSRNIIKKSDSTHYGELLSVSKATGSAFAAVIAQENTFQFALWGSAHADEIVIRGNTTIRSATDTRQATIQGDASHITIEDNYCKGGGRISVTTIGGGARNLLTSVKQNTVIGTTSTLPFSISEAQEVVCEANTIGEASDVTQVNPIGFQNIDLLHIKDDIYLGEGVPSFSSVGVAPSTFSFQRTITLNPAATTFSVWTIPASMSVVPVMAQGRCNTDVSATNGNFWSLGLDTANRRTTYGVCTTAAATNKHSKNAKFRFVASPVDGGGKVADASDVIRLMSVDTSAGTAVLASNMGGASQTITIRMQVMLIGLLPSVP